MSRTKGWTTALLAFMFGVWLILIRGNSAALANPVMLSGSINAAGVTGAAETTLWSGIVPGGLLTPNTALIIETDETVLNNSGVNQSYTYRWYYGGQLMLTQAITGSTPNPIPQIITHRISLTAQQEPKREEAFGLQFLPTVASTSPEGAGSVDSSVPQVLKLTGQTSSNMPSQALKVLLVQAYTVTTANKQPG